MPPISNWLCSFLVSIACLTALTTQTFSASAASSSVFFEDKTWTEIEQALNDGTRTIVIPVGGTEQSGPYIAVGKHNKRVTHLARCIAQQNGHTLVAPTVDYTPEGNVFPRTGHMRFPGTLTLTSLLFENLLKEIATSFQVQGFTRIILLGDHGGYQNILAHVEKQLNQKWQSTGTRVLYIKDYYNIAYTAYPAWLKKQGYTVASRQHADIVDTSLSLGTSPEDVRWKMLKNAQHFSPQEGIYGAAPSNARADLGVKGLQMQVQAALAEIKKKDSALQTNASHSGL